MATRFRLALNRFRTRESPSLRGRYFKKVALLIERHLRRREVSQKQIVEWFGAPDLFSQTEWAAAYVYRFDHTKASKRRDEWYFFFRDGLLITSGYNHAGINQFSGFQASSAFPSQNIN
ncbi:MAG: hypothetical protein JWN70_2891 [Planctomycetaceae bacterium]|nr:hypothetical protein [Planctomycetaceae bacterium]